MVADPGGGERQCVAQDDEEQCVQQQRLPQPPFHAAADAQRLLPTATCAADLREACKAGSSWQQHATLFGFSNAGSELTQLSQDLAFFLLARGPFAW